MQNKNFWILSWILVLTLLSCHEGLAQSAEAPKTSNAQSFLRTVGGDMVRVFSSPLRLSKNDGLHLIAFTTVTAGFYAFLDAPVDEEYARENRHAVFYPAKKLAGIGKIYDDISPVNFSIGISAGLLVGGIVLQDKKLLETTRLVIESVLLNKTITSFSKGVIGRSRPYGERGPHDLNLFKSNRAEEFRSMPSGHVSNIFAIIGVIDKQYDHWWVKIPAYTLGVSVAFQRMNDRQHWASDVIVGGGLGYWIGSALANKKPEGSKRSSFHPYLFKNTVGVAINF